MILNTIAHSYRSKTHWTFCKIFFEQKFKLASGQAGSGDLYPDCSNISQRLKDDKRVLYYI
jgi:hypothetical protein